MINKIKNSYYSYTPGEFLPIYIEGVPANVKEFHLYKLKKVALKVDAVWERAINYGR